MMFRARRESALAVDRQLQPVLWLALLALALALGACAKTDSYDDGGLLDVMIIEAGVICGPEEIDQDADGDGLTNGEENCLSLTADSDHDGINDWRDYDSDGDGISDEVEKGTKVNGQCATSKDKSWPCDHDGDGAPDYLDLDSDNDKVLDKDEDANGDGFLGCCLVKCGQLDDKWQKANCDLTTDGCGPGQTCEKGSCQPAASFSCSEGETSPLLKDTFGDGKLDGERGTFICRDATEDHPKGRKTPKTSMSQAGDWNVAVEQEAKYGELSLSNPAAKEAAATIDYDGALTEVAGFVISRSTTNAKVQEELQDIIAAIQARVPGGPGTVDVRSSGTEVKSHDRFDSVQGTIIDLSTDSATNISKVRNELLSALLDRPTGELGNLPGAYGASGRDFIIRFLTVRRFAFKKDQNGAEILDSKGYPVDDGDTSRWRLMIMGAVSLRPNYQDPLRRTGFVTDDLSNGTGLATFSDGLSDECDVGTITQLPVADIIWVIDESGSMSGERDNVKANAANFFSRALAAGLDFRMCVTGVNNTSTSNKPLIGKCCSATGGYCNNGGTDRFLLSTEDALFAECITDPPGCEGGSEYGLSNMREAVTRHLPRASNTEDKIRPEAKVVIIVATDEAPEEYKDAGIVGEEDKSCSLPSAKKAAADAYLKPYLDLFTGITDPEAAAMVHLIGRICNSACSGDGGTGFGYIELAQALGGQTGDICQSNLGNTLQVIIDSIVGAASPVKLAFVPISSSLAVALDGKEIPRSRTDGFDYNSSSNSLIFINVKYKKGSEVIASYHRWKEQIVPQ